MKAIVLVAGYASRLYPLTLDTPKALLTLNGVTLLDYLVKKVEEVDVIDELILVSNHKFYDKFLNWKKSYLGKLKITVLDDGTSTNETRLGAIGDTEFAIETLKIDEEIMLLVSDNYFTFSLKDFYNFYLKKGSDCIVVTEFEDLVTLGKNFACINVDSNYQVTKMVEKPGGIPDTNIGAYASYIYTKDSVRMIKEYLRLGNNKDAPGNYPSWLYTRKPIFAYSFEGECYDIGTPEVYYALDKKLSANKTKSNPNKSKWSYPQKSRIKISKKHLKRY